MTLYELDGEYLRLYDMATELDDEQAFKDTLACLDSELEAKGNGYIRVIKTLEMEAKQCDEELERIKRKKEVRENAVKRLKQALITALDIAGKKDITCGEYTLKIRNNGGLQPLKQDRGVASSPDRVSEPFGFHGFLRLFSDRINQAFPSAVRRVGKSPVKMQTFSIVSFFPRRFIRPG